MKNSILLTLFVTAGLVVGCGGKDDDAGATAPNTSADDDGGDDGSGAVDDGDGSGAVDDGATGVDDGGTMPADDGGSAGDDSTGNEPPNDEGGIGFIDTPDGGGVSFECDLFAQDCPAGEKCMPWSNNGGPAWNATRCSPLDPNPAQAGDECMVEGSGVSGIDNCDIGLMCWGVDTETNIGTCIELCGCGPEEPTCAGGGTFCVISNENALPICLSTCDPLVADVCPAGEGCYPLDANFLCAPDASLDEGQQDDPCEYINVCDPGLACMFGVGDCGAAGCCAQFCDIDTGNADCSGLTECIPFFPEGTEPEECHVDTGVCLEP